MSEVLLKSDNWPKSSFWGDVGVKSGKKNTPKIAATSGETCHTDRDKAAVAKSKLHPLHWQQREELALRNVCLGNMEKLYKDIVSCKEFGVKFKDITKILTCWLLMSGCCHLSHLVQGWLCVYMNWYLHWHVSIVGMCLLSATILISVALVHHPAII